MFSSCQNAGLVEFSIVGLSIRSYQDIGIRKVQAIPLRVTLLPSPTVVFLNVFSSCQRAGLVGVLVESSIRRHQGVEIRKVQAIPIKGNLAAIPNDGVLKCIF